MSRGKAKQRARAKNRTAAHDKKYGYTDVAGTLLIRFQSLWDVSPTQKPKGFKTTRILGQDVPVLLTDSSGLGVV